MKFIDLFAGCGGFRRGMELAGHKCVGFCEFDKFATASYTAMHLITEEQRKYIDSIPTPLKRDGNRNLRKRQKEIWKEEYRNGEWYANDITTVDARSMPDADCWCFGAPCQDFSIAGKRKGLSGDRSSLVRKVFELVAELPEERRPTYLVYENVKGMLSSNHGWDFACILIEMEQLGYDVEYQLLNSKNFGVPQNRERVFVIGHYRGRSTSKVFPVIGTAGGNTVKQLGNLVTTGNWNNPQRGRYYSVKGLAPSQNCCGGGGQETKVAIPVLTPERAEKRQNGRRFKESGEPMFTLTAQNRHGVYNGLHIRRLIPKECFRLQGWEDKYFYRAELVNSDSQLYKQAGNGVTVNVVAAIAEKLE